MHEIAALQAVRGQATPLLQRNLQLSNEFVLTRQRMPHQAVSRAVKEEGHRQGKAKGNAELFCQGNKCAIPWGSGASMIVSRREERESPDVTCQVVVSATLLVGLFAVCCCIYVQIPSRLIRCFIRLFDELDQFVVTKTKKRFAMVELRVGKLSGAIRQMRRQIDNFHQRVGALHRLERMMLIQDRIRHERTQVPAANQFFRNLQMRKSKAVLLRQHQF